MIHLDRSMTWLLLGLLFLFLSAADLISTIVGLNLGLVESGLSAGTVGAMGTITYSVFRIAGAGITLLLFRGLGLLFVQVMGMDLPLKIIFYLVTVVLAGVVANNAAMILLVSGGMS